MLLLVTVLVMLRLGAMAAEELFYAPGPLLASADIVVPAGGTAVVAAALQSAGVIRHPLVLRAAAYFTHADGPLRAGEFVIPARSSLADVLDILRHGVPVEHQVTIPEGLTGAQIAKILNAAPAARGEVAPPAEGSTLPQTYDYLWGADRQAILARATTAMQQDLAVAWAHRDSRIPLATAGQAVILASIVQQESPLPAELPKIAAVYENRLRQGMRLQADPTVIFAASGGKQSGGAAISRADLANPSPYNTYLYAGLPPGPICAPGMAAIDAVLHPASSDALYFVATGDGGHVFTRYFKEQLRNIERFWKRHE